MSTFIFTFRSTLPAFAPSNVIAPARGHLRPEASGCFVVISQRDGWLIGAGNGEGDLAGHVSTPFQHSQYSALRSICQFTFL